MANEHKLTEEDISAGCAAALAIFKAQHQELSYPGFDGPYKVGFADGCAFICDLMQAERKKS